MCLDHAVSKAKPKIESCVIKHHNNCIKPQWDRGYVVANKLTDTFVAQVLEPHPFPYAPQSKKSTESPTAAYAM